MKHRAWNRFRAAIGRYFWLPCPMCGKNFGGHESSGCLMTDYGSGRSVCPDCKKEAEKISEERMKDWTKHGVVDPETGIFHYDVR